MGGPRPRAPGCGCASCRRRACGTSSRAAPRAIPRPSAAARRPGGSTASGATGGSAARCSSARRRARRARSRPRWIEPRSCARGPEAWLAVSTNPSLIPFAGAPLDADFRLPEDVLESLRPGRSTCASFARRTAGRSRPASGRSGERLRDPRRGGRRRRRNPRALRARLQDPAARRGVALEVRAATRTAGTASSRSSTAGSSATTRAGAMRFLTRRGGAAALLGRRRRDRSVRAGPGRAARRLPRDDRGVLRGGRRAPGCRSASGFRTRARSGSASASSARARSFRSSCGGFPSEAFGPPPPDVEAGDASDERFDPLWEAAPAHVHRTRRCATACA